MVTFELIAIVLDTEEKESIIKIIAFICISLYSFLTYFNNHFLIDIGLSFWVFMWSYWRISDYSNIQTTRINKLMVFILHLLVVGIYYRDRDYAGEIA